MTNAAGPSIFGDLSTRFPLDVSDLCEANGQQWGYVKKTAALEVLAFLKNECGFNILMDLNSVDYLHWEEKAERFEIVYNIFSAKRNERIILRVKVSEDDAVVDSAASVWPAADWLEREVWDMFGIRFTGHPGLKRILMYEEFQGHALRKDYPYGKRQPLIGPKN